MLLGDPALDGKHRRDRFGQTVARRCSSIFHPPQHPNGTGYPGDVGRWWEDAILNPALTKPLQQRFGAGQHTGRANTPQNTKPEPARCAKPGPAAPGHPRRHPTRGAGKGGDRGKPGAGNPAQTRTLVSAFGDDLMLFWNRKRLLGRRHLLLVWAEQSRLHFSFTLPASVAEQLNELFNFCLSTAIFAFFSPSLRPPDFHSVGQPSGELSLLHKEAPVSLWPRVSPYFGVETTRFIFHTLFVLQHLRLQLSTGERQGRQSLLPEQ